MDTTDNPRPENEWARPPQEPAEPTDVPTARARPAWRPTRFGGRAKVVAPVVAALLVGGGAVFAVDHNSNSTASAGTQAAGFGNASGAGRTGQFGGGAGGPVAGEQHIEGTVTAKTGSTVTVKSSSDTATYTVNATTEIVRNGQTATLSDVQVGDPVLVHVYPSSSGQTLVERLFAGSSARGGPGGFGGGPPATGGGTQSSGSST